MQLAEYTRVACPDFPGDRRHPAAWVAERGEVLRELPGRCVFRARVGGLAVVVKEWTPRRLRHWLRSYAEAELDKALAVRERGVPVVEPVACARLADGRQILVLKEETGARELKSVWLDDRPTGAARHALARRLGVLIATMQNAGIRHHDPHAGNILVRPDGSLLLADAWDLVPGDYLTPRQRAHDLANFSLFFLTHASLVDLLVFWGEYGRASELQPAHLEELRTRLFEHVPVAFRRLSGMRARKTRRCGRAVDADGWKGIVTGDIADDALAPILQRARRLGPGDDVLKESPTAWTLTAGAERDLVVKVYLPKKATRALRDWIQGTRAERALEAAEALFHRGLRTPEVVAVLRDTTMPGRSVLVMRRAEGTTLSAYARQADAMAAREAAQRLGRLLRRMHDWGLRHRDLKQDNLLVAPDGGFVLLDLDGIRQTRGPLDWDRRARDLANLDSTLFGPRSIPLGLRLRALDAYVGGDLPPGKAPRAWARDVAELARARREQRKDR